MPDLLPGTRARRATWSDMPRRCIVGGVLPENIVTLVEPPTPSVRPFLRRCRLRNYRSIAQSDVELCPLTLLVGPNGSGKSNFVDALRLVTEAVTTSLEHALHERGGIQQVRRRSGGHPTHFAVALELQLPEGVDAAYRFEVGAVAGGAFKITREQCRVGPARFEVREGALTVRPAEVAPPPLPDRLYLVTAAGLPAFRPLYDGLARMGFYNVQPERIRALQPPDQGELLARDGSNLASVVRRMRQVSPGAMTRVEDFLRQVVPGLEGVDALPMGHMTTLEFRQRVEGAEDPWRFPAINMSDGTLRALALLVALFQPVIRAGVPLVGIEEPETALHPAAAGILFDALRSATRHTQVVVTSHSPELLDHPSLAPEEVLAVNASEGRTEIGPLDEASRSAMCDRLYTGGELLRSAQLEPARVAGVRATPFFEKWSAR
jgi:predicted ATPase